MSKPPVDNLSYFYYRPHSTPIRYPKASLFSETHEKFAEYLIPLHFISEKEFPFIYCISCIFTDDNGKIDYRWCIGDDEKNYKIKYDELKASGKLSNWYWKDREVTYKSNWNGYRALDWEEYDWSESIVVFGCSMTYGVGISNEDVFCHHLEKLTGRSVINLSVPAGSNDLILFNLTRMFRNFGSPHAVVVGYTTIDREMSHHYMGIDKIGPWNAVQPRAFEQDLFDKGKYFVDDERYYEVNFLENPYHPVGKFVSIVETIKSMVAGRCKFVDFSWWGHVAEYANASFLHAKDNGVTHDPLQDKARDLMHEGVNCHKELADKIYERL